MKCKVVHLGWSNPLHQCRLGADWLRSSASEEDLGVMTDAKFHITNNVLSVLGRETTYYIRRSLDSRLRELSLLGIGVSAPETLRQIWFSS